MAIFSRRSIQRMINENASFLNADQLERHVRELNKPRRVPLQVEWEVALLWCLSHFGEVKHEPQLGGYKPDILFRGEVEAGFIAEVTTISDQGNEQKALIEEFQYQLWRLRLKRGLSGRGFYWSIGRKRSDDPKKVLKLPPKEEIHCIFDETFLSFLDDIATYPTKEHLFERKTTGTDVTIEYRPNDAGSGGHHPTFAEAFHLTRNPVYNALKGKKAKMKKVDFSGPKIIVLCDGGCETLRHDPMGWDAFGVPQIIHEFLRQNTSIDAVTVISTHTDIPPLGGGMVARIEQRHLLNLKATYPLSDDLLTSLQKGISALPKPIYDSLNAASWYKSKQGGTGVSHFGGSHGQGRSISLSSREVTDLLAGNRSQAEIFAAHRFDGVRKKRPNPFKYWSDEGRMVIDISLERSDVFDDDWVTFHFGEPDPALSSFVNPKAVQQTNK